MKQGDDDSGRIDLEALLREGAPRESTQTPTAPPPLRRLSDESIPCDPLATVPNDLYLLVSRLSAAPPIPADDRDSLGALTTEPTSAPPIAEAHSSLLRARGRSPTRIAIAAALAVAMVTVATALVLFRSGSVTTAVRAPTRTDTAGARSTPAPTLVPDERAVLERHAPNEMRAAQTTAQPTPRRRLRATGSDTTAKPAEQPSSETTSTDARAKPATLAPSNTPSASDQPSSASPQTETAAASESAGSTALKQPSHAPTPAATAPPTAAPLEDAMRDAVRAGSQLPTDATGAVVGPNRPSLGATTAALRAVLPAASSCLGPGDSVRNGQVVFASDGSVARVQLAGSTREDDCIRSALSKAKLPPFREETFAARVTVRP